MKTLLVLVATFVLGCPCPIASADLDAGKKSVRVLCDDTLKVAILAAGVKLVAFGDLEVFDEGICICWPYKEITLRCLVTRVGKKTLSVSVIIPRRLSPCGERIPALEYIRLVDERETRGYSPEAIANGIASHAIGLVLDVKLLLSSEGPEV